MRIWLAVLAVVVAVAGVVLYVLAREQAAPVAVAPRDAAPVAVSVTRGDAAVAAVTAADAAADAAPGRAAALETLRASGSASEVWAPQAANLLHGFDPAAKVECYVAGCGATLTFDSQDAYEHAVELVRTDETWTGGKKWADPVREGGRISAVLILYRPD